MNSVQSEYQLGERVQNISWGKTWFQNICWGNGCSKNQLGERRVQNISWGKEAFEIWVGGKQEFRISFERTSDQNVSWRKREFIISVVFLTGPSGVDMFGTWRGWNWKFSGAKEDKEPKPRQLVLYSRQNSYSSAVKLLITNH